MSTENEIIKLSDSSQPNAGRVYDYLLGGNYNCEIDRQMAEQLIQKVPFLPKMAKLTRWFLQESIDIAVKRGFNQFLDFASGLPTVDHIHNRTPEETKIIYSDIDSITVRLARNLLKEAGDNPNIKYLVCDAGEPETILESDEVKNLFGSNHKVVIGINGVCWFLSDEQISHALKVLYDWADEGSMVYICDGDTDNITDDFQSLLDLYRSMKQPIFNRSKSKLMELIKPWKIEEPGFLPFEEWLDLSTTTTKESFNFLGGGSYGGYLKK